MAVYGSSPPRGSDSTNSRLPQSARRGARVPSRDTRKQRVRQQHDLTRRGRVKLLDPTHQVNLVVVVRLAQDTVDKRERPWHRAISEKPAPLAICIEH